MSEIVELRERVEIDRRERAVRERRRERRKEGRERERVGREFSEC